VAVALNYAEHIAETGMETPAAPVLFAKWPSAVQDPGGPIVLDEGLTREVDWEGELAVVLGRGLRHASEAEALSAVLGYTVANDVTARDLQRADGQWTRAKSLDTFCPLGPAVVTPDEIGDPQGLRIETRVNDDVVQRASTASMIFGVAELLAFCSRSFPLHPGDVVLTGTPWGCGAFATPPRSLAAGDVVSVRIDGIGTLTNPVVAGP
jgi:5-carboxymethyl-2-hydroxymuconate isomerase